MTGKSAQHRLFSKRTFGWLREIGANNNKVWFDENRERYERDVREPALAYIDSMVAPLRRISPHFTAVAKKSGGSLMRVHRDMRFARDSDPYKTNVGIQFRHERGRDVHAPGFYVHIEPGQCFLGAGLWRPEPAALKAIRTEILDRPDVWRRATTAAKFTEKFQLSGEQLSRPPRGFAADLPCIDAIQRKDFIALSPVSDTFMCRRDLPGATSELFSRVTSLMRFLCAALDLEF